MSSMTNKQALIEAFEKWWQESDDVPLPGFPPATNKDWALLGWEAALEAIEPMLKDNNAIPYSDEELIEMFICPSGRIGLTHDQLAKKARAIWEESYGQPRRQAGWRGFEAFSPEAKQAYRIGYDRGVADAEKPPKNEEL